MIIAPTVFTSVQIIANAAPVGDANVVVLELKEWH